MALCSYAVGKYVQKVKQRDIAPHDDREGLNGSSRRRYRVYPAKKENADVSRRSRAQQQQQQQNNALNGVTGSRLLSKLSHSLSLCQRANTPTSATMTSLTSSANEG